MRGQRTGEGVDAALGHGIIEQVLIAHQAGDRAGHDDGRARLHVRDRRLGHVEIAVQIGAQGAVEVFLGQVLEVLDVLLEGGVVDQYVQGAQVADRALDRFSGEQGIADIALEHDGAAALALDRLAGGVGVLRLVQMGDGDIGPFTSEQHSHRAANAGVRAGDQGDLALQLA